MNKRTSWMTVGGIVLLGLILLAVYLGQQKHISWWESYAAKSSDPFGTQVIHQLLDGYFPGEAFYDLNTSIAEGLPQDSLQNATYCFIGNGQYVDSTDVNALLEFVGEGNQAFIASKTVPYELMFYLYFEECNETPWEEYNVIATDTAIRMNLLTPGLSMEQAISYQFILRGEKSTYYWNYIDDAYFCEEEYGLQPIGVLQDSLINFVRIPYGAGTFYVHTNPLVFSNIQLLDKSGLDYVDRVFSHLKPGAIYWDVFSKVPENAARNRNNPMGEKRLSNESPLQYILSQPPLAMAWYLLLLAGLLFLLFRTKRRQRVIPVLAPNRNTSLEFLQTVGLLYFLQNDHKKLALQEMKLFLGHIRENYQLPTRELDEQFAAQLAGKSEVPLTEINAILLLYKNIKSSSLISDETIIRFNRQLEAFYEKAK